MPSAVVTPVDPVSVRLFAVADEATLKANAVPLTLAVTPVRPPSAALSLAPPFAATVSVEVPAVPPAATMRSSRLVELMLRLVTASAVSPTSAEWALAVMVMSVLTSLASILIWPPETEATAWPAVLTLPAMAALIESRTAVFASATPTAAVRL